MGGWGSEPAAVRRTGVSAMLRVMRCTFRKPQLPIQRAASAAGLRGRSGANAAARTADRLQGVAATHLASAGAATSSAAAAATPAIAEPGACARTVTAERRRVARGAAGRLRQARMAGSGDCGKGGGWKRVDDCYNDLLYEWITMSLVRGM